MSLKSWKCTACGHDDNISECGKSDNCENCGKPSFVACDDAQPTDTPQDERSSIVGAEKGQEIDSTFNAMQAFIATQRFPLTGRIATGKKSTALILHPDRGAIKAEQAKKAYTKSYGIFDDSLPWPYGHTALQFLPKDEKKEEFDLSQLYPTNYGKSMWITRMQGNFHTFLEIPMPLPHHCRCTLPKIHMYNTLPKDAMYFIGADVASDKPDITSFSYIMRPNGEMMTMGRPKIGSEEWNEIIKDIAEKYNANSEKLFNDALMGTNVEPVQNPESKTLKDMLKFWDDWSKANPKADFDVDDFVYFEFDAFKWLIELCDAPEFAFSLLWIQFRLLDAHNNEDAFMTWLLKTHNLQYERSLRVVKALRYYDKKRQEKHDTRMMETLMQYTTADITQVPKSYYGACPQCGHITDFEPENYVHGELYLFCGEHGDSFSINDLIEVKK